ncbi:unnamed protein product [Amoebophrya sp. A120]|nr:unnamed protein product [Amoebophrya sp. A120]|eukprot:GSA120T00022978001.1
MPPEDDDLLASLGVKMVQQSSVESKIKRVMDAQTSIHEVKRDVRRSELEVAKLQRMVERMQTNDPRASTLAETQRKLRAEEEKLARLKADRDRLQGEIDLGQDMSYMNSGERLNEDNLNFVPVASSSPEDSTGRGSFAENLLPSSSEPEQHAHRNAATAAHQQDLSFGMKTFGDDEEDGIDIQRRERKRRRISPAREKEQHMTEEDLFGVITADVDPHSKKNRQIQENNKASGSSHWRVADQGRDWDFVSDELRSDKIQVKTEIAASTGTTQQKRPMQAPPAQASSTSHYVQVKQESSSSAEAVPPIVKRERRSSSIEEEQLPAPGAVIHAQNTTSSPRQQASRRRSSLSHSSDVIDMTHLWTEMPTNLLHLHQQRSSSVDEAQKSASRGNNTQHHSQNQSGGTGSVGATSSQYHYPTAPFRKKSGTIAKLPSSPRGGARQNKGPARARSRSASKELDQNSPRLSRAHSSLHRGSGAEGSLKLEADDDFFVDTRQNRNADKNHEENYDDEKVDGISFVDDFVVDDFDDDSMQDGGSPNELMSWLRDKTAKANAKIEKQKQEDEETKLRPESRIFPLMGTQLQPRSTGGLDMRAVQLRQKKLKAQKQWDQEHKARSVQDLDLRTQDLIKYGSTGEVNPVRGFGNHDGAHQNGRRRMILNTPGGTTRTTGKDKNRDDNDDNDSTNMDVDNMTDKNTHRDGPRFLPHGKKPHKTHHQQISGTRKHLKDDDPRKVRVPKEVLLKPAHLRTEAEKELVKAADRARLRAFDDVDDDFYTKQLEENPELDQDTRANPEKNSWIVPGELRIPNYIWDNLYGYQKTAVKWMYNLHKQQVGGILADEMGLGKTIQIVAFLAALYHSNILQTATTRQFGTGPPKTGGVLILCPTTLVEQWRDEIKSWFPVFRVSIMHQVDAQLKEEMMEKITANNGILITSYETFRIYSESLIFNYPWTYLIMDEGHKIRNPDAAITLVCKKIDTPHRIVLSGTPIQNRLSELWSIFDFIQPGLLGTFPVFQQQFSDVIEAGGQMTATPRMVEAAYQAAQILREETLPFLLRRTKADVQDIVRLPPKQEQILFCNLTPQQYQVYLDFLQTDKVKQARMQGNLAGTRTGTPQIFFIMSVLRKLCNHPDLLLKDYPDLLPQDYGAVMRSGKMLVLGEILKRWKKDGHKVLLFTQTVQMLEILENWISTELQYESLRMDGKTPVAQRQRLIAKFNETEDIFVMIMSTKVGGIGLNITGANRVVLFDPDWNPSTDVQARERAWRIGQQREVTVYRLVTAGTLEEKIYHRQIFKHFLSQKILNDPRQKRFMKINDAQDLLTEPPPPPGWDPNATLLQDHDQISSGFPRAAGGATNPINFATKERFRQLFQKFNQGKKNGAANPDEDQDTVETIKLLGDLNDNPLPEANKPSDEASQENKAMLASLLDPSRGLVRSSFSHDRVEHAPSLDSGLVLHGRERAKQALQALEASRDMRRQHAVSVPTWTGRKGEAGNTKAGRDNYNKHHLFNIAPPAGGTTASGSAGTSSYNNANVPTVVPGSTSSSSSSRGVNNPVVQEKNVMQKLTQQRRERFEKLQRFDSVNAGTNQSSVNSAVEQFKQIKAIQQFKQGGDSQMESSKKRIVRRENKLQRFDREQQEILQERAERQEELLGSRVETADVKLAKDVLSFFLNDRVCPHRSASTTQVLDHFDGQVAPHHKHLFKNVLQELCVLDKPVNKMLPSVWTLKQQFRKK